jgi:cell division protein FtsX
MDAVCGAGRIAPESGGGPGVTPSLVTPGPGAAVAGIGRRPESVLTAADRQVIDCATVIRTGQAGRSIVVTLDPTATPSTIEAVRAEVAGTGAVDVRVHSAEANAQQLRDVLGAAADVDPSAVGASITATVPVGTPGGAEGALARARSQPGVVSGATGAVACRIEEDEARALLEQYLRGRWQGGADLVVQLAPTTPVAERDAIRAALREDPVVRQAWAVDQQDAHAELACRFAADPAAMASVPAEALPWTYRVDLVDGASVSAARDRLRAHPGIVAVSEPPTLEVLTGLPLDAASYQRLVEGIAGTPDCVRSGRPLR